MPNTVQNARAAIMLHQAEIKNLLGQVPVDTLAIEQLQAATVRELKVIRSAQNLTAAAPRNEPKPEITAFMAQFFPRAQTLLTPGAFRATR